MQSYETLLIVRYDHTKSNAKMTWPFQVLNTELHSTVHSQHSENEMDNNGV